MDIISTIKEIAELITSISAAFIVVRQALKILPQSIKDFFVKVIPVFFCGIATENKGKVRFFKALKIKKEQQEQFKSVLKSITSEIETEEYLVLNKTELNRVLTESRLFKKVIIRKQ